MNNKQRKELPYTLAILGVLLVACLILELILSCWKYAAVLGGTPVTYDVKAEMSGFGVEMSGVTWEDGVWQVPKKGGTLVLTGDIPELHSLYFVPQYETSASSYVKLALYASYAGTEQKRQLISNMEYGMMTTGIPVNVVLDTLEDVTSLEIRFPAADADYIVQELRLNGVTPDVFHTTRFVLLYGLAVLIFLCIRCRVSEVTFAPGTQRHELMYWGTMIVCLWIACMVYVFLIGSSVKQDIAYPLKNVSYQQCFVQQFDALMKGQLHLDVEPSAELLALENPYDPSQRTGIGYLWDRALYDGKYYSYFGIAPVLLVYLPYYLVCGTLPGAAKVMFFYGVVGIVALFGILHAWIKAFRLRVNLFLLCLGSSTVVFTSGLLLLMRGWSSVYYLASLAGLASLLVFLWVSLKAYQEKHFVKQLLLFLLSGVCLVITVASRVNHGFLGIVMVAPIYIKYLLEKRPRGQKIAAAAGFLVPALLGAAVLAGYNVARFGSALEFGSSYQLTVSDIRENHFAFNRVIPAIFHYFMQPVKWTGDFPFVQFQHVRLNHYGYYVYIDTNMGILNYPLALVSFGMLGLLWLKRPKAAGGVKEKDENVPNWQFHHVVCGITLLASVFLAIVNFSLGGVNYRYTYDMSFAVNLVGAFVLWELYGLAQAYMPKGTKRIVFGIAVAVMTLTIFVAVMLLVNHYNGNFVDYAPIVWTKLRDFFVFW